jgi:hypothetical protein
MGKFLEMTLYNSMRLGWFSSWLKLQLEDGRLRLPLVVLPCVVRMRSFIIHTYVHPHMQYMHNVRIRSLVG